MGRQSAFGLPAPLLAIRPEEEWCGPLRHPLVTICSSARKAGPEPEQAPSLSSLCIFLSGSQGSFFPLAPPLSPPGRRKGNCHQSPYLYKKTVCFLCQKKHRKGAVRGEGTQPQTLRGQFIFCRHGLGTPTALAVGDAVCELGSSQDSTAWPLFLTSAFLLHLRGPFPLMLISKQLS